MGSPIIRLISQIKQSVNKGLPQLCRKLLFGKNPPYYELRLSTDSRRLIMVNNQLQKLEVSLQYLEHLWASLYTFHLIHEKCDAYRTQGAVFYSIQDDPKLQQALEVYKQTKQRVHQPKSIHWRNVSQVIENVPLQAMTDTFFLRSLEYTLLPEYISHIKEEYGTNHTDTLPSKSMAPIKMFMEVASNRKDYTRRGISWATVLLLQKTEILLHHENISQDHIVHAYAHILSLLNLYFANPNHPVYLYFSMLFHAHTKGFVPLHIKNNTTWLETLIQDLRNTHNSAHLFSELQIEQLKHGV